MMVSYSFTVIVVDILTGQNLVQCLYLEQLLMAAHGYLMSSKSHPSAIRCQYVIDACI